MRFKNERVLWHSETEDLAAKLVGKSKDEIQDIFEDNDVISLKTCEKIKVTIIGRLLCIPVFLLMVIVSVFKWFMTGDRYLDSWFKKYKTLEIVREYTGLK